MKLDVKDVAEYQEKHREYLNLLVEVNFKDFDTKKEIVVRLIEVTRPLVSNGYVKGLKLEDLATYINNRLEEYGVVYPRNQEFYNLFKDSEKRDYGTNLLSTSHRNHVHKFVDDECECGIIKRNDLLYERHIEKEEKPEKESGSASEKTQSTKKPQNDPYSNDYTEYLQTVKFNLQEMATQCDDLISKYFSNEVFANSIKSALKDVKKLQVEQKSVEARLIKTRKQSDFRNKIGEFEKLKAIMLWRAGHIHSHIAKVLAITPKHMSHNILKNVDSYMKILAWFGTIDLKCRYCSESNTYSLSDYYEEQVARRTLDLPQEQPVQDNV